MPNVERECVTHHYACDCREERFKCMEAALRAVEWNAMSCYEEIPNGFSSGPACPLCGMSAKSGHAPDCLIGLALAGEKGE